MKKKNHVGWFNRSVFCFKSEEHVFFASEPPLATFCQIPRCFLVQSPAPASNLQSRSDPHLFRFLLQVQDAVQDQTWRCGADNQGEIFPKWWKPGGYSSQMVKIDENLVNKPLEWWFFPINPRLGQRPAVHLRGQRSMFPSIKINTWWVKTYEPTIFGGINIYEPAVSG